MLKLGTITITGCSFWEKLFSKGGPWAERLCRSYAIDIYLTIRSCFVYWSTFQFPKFLFHLWLRKLTTKALNRIQGLWLVNPKSKFSLIGWFCGIVNRFCLVDNLMDKIDEDNRKKTAWKLSTFTNNCQALSLSLSLSVLPDFVH